MPIATNMGAPLNAYWWAGDNEEFYGVGPCKTRDEALTEALGYFGDERPIHLLQAQTADWSPPDAETVIDIMIDNSDELFFDDGFPGMDGTAEEVAKAQADLANVLAHWLQNHRGIFPTPTAFGWTGEREVVTEFPPDPNAEQGK